MEPDVGGVVVAYGVLKGHPVDRSLKWVVCACVSVAHAHVVANSACCGIRSCSATSGTTDQETGSPIRKIMWAVPQKSSSQGRTLHVLHVLAISLQ